MYYENYDKTYVVVQRFHHEMSMNIFLSTFVQLFVGNLLDGHPPDIARDETMRLFIRRNEYHSCIFRECRSPVDVVAISTVENKYLPIPCREVRCSASYSSSSR